MPIAPFRVFLISIDQIAGVEEKSCSWSVSEGFPENARPMRLHFILGVSKIDKGEGVRRGACCFEMKILGPIRSVADSISVERV